MQCWRSEEFELERLKSAALFYRVSWSELLG